MVFDRSLVRGSEALALAGAEVGRLHGVELIYGIDGGRGEEVGRRSVRPSPYQRLLQAHQAAFLAVQAEVTLQVYAPSVRVRGRTVVRAWTKKGKKKTRMSEVKMRP